MKDKSIYIPAFLFTLSPVFYKTYDKAGHDNFLLSFLILLWMGFVILFFIFFFLIDIYNISLKVIHHITGHNPLPSLSGRKVFIVIFLLTLFTTTYGYIETLNLKIYRFTIPSKKVKRDIKIMQISDLHLNQVMREDKIQMVLDIYIKEKPDIVISTGDLVDGNLRYKEPYIKLLQKINPPLGKYAILGNHEYYADVEQSIEFTEKAGFKLLRDNIFYLQDNIVLVGVDDEEAERFGVKRNLDDLELLDKVDKSKFIIFLKHQPKIDERYKDKFDLALAGHTHGGVLFPVRYILREIFIIDAGLVRLGNEYVFVSRGVGTGGPPIRIGAFPDVAIFEIKKSP
ncbi:MAG: metallophosphoesterase [Hydrogenothermaceae bacterium]|nr:metallophosphoesterase [Hydrogenothermaceae bacterium]